MPHVVSGIEGKVQIQWVIFHIVCNNFITVNNKNIRKTNDLLCINQMIGKNCKRFIKFYSEGRDGGQRLTANQSEQAIQSGS